MTMDNKKTGGFGRLKDFMDSNFGKPGEAIKLLKDLSEAVASIDQAKPDKDILDQIDGQCADGYRTASPHCRNREDALQRRYREGKGVPAAARQHPADSQTSAKRRQPERAPYR